MKTTYLYLTLIVPIFSFAQLDSTKGKVKSIKHVVFYTDKPSTNLLIKRNEMNFGQYNLSLETIFEDFSQELFPSQIFGFENHFNKNSKIVRSITFGNNGDTNTNTYYFYDKDGIISQEKVIYNSGEYEITNFRNGILKDSQIHLLATMTYGSDTANFNIKQYYYTKDFNANLVETRNVSGFLWNDTKETYKYDSSQRVIKETRFFIDKSYNNTSGIISLKDTLNEYYSKEYIYNIDGNILETTEGCKPYLVKAACMKTFFEYDEQKRVKRKLFYWSDSLFSIRTFHYNPDNTIKKIEWFYKDEKKPKSHIEYTYLKKELIKAVYNNNGIITLIEFKYKTDAHNNWTEQLKFINNKEEYKRIREIEYWD